MALNGGSSLQFDDEGTSELAAEIYELEREKLELGQIIGHVWFEQFCLPSRLDFKTNFT